METFVLVPENRSGNDKSTEVGAANGEDSLMSKQCGVDRNVPYGLVVDRGFSDEQAVQMGRDLQYCHVLEKYIYPGLQFVRSVASQQELGMTYGICPQLEPPLKLYPGNWHFPRFLERPRYNPIS